MNSSKITRAMTVDGSARVLAIHATALVRDAVRYHKTAPTATAAFGRTLTAASLMGCLMKNPEDTMTLQFKGDGPAGTILASADYSGNVKGYISNPNCDVPRKPGGKLDVSAAIGRGSMYVIRDEGGKEPYVGIIPIISGEVAEDITSYYAESEQIPTLCALGVLVGTDLDCRAAGGILVQLLPGADSEVIDRLEENAASLTRVSQMIDEGMTPEDLIATALKGIPYDLFDEIEVGYRCDCSAERMARAMLTLSDEDLDAIFEGQETAIAECRFCNATYEFTREDLERRRLAAKS